MRRLANVFAGVILGLGALWLAARLVPLPARFWATDSQAIYFRDGSLAYAFLSSDGKLRLPVNLERVDAAYLTALLRYEDRRFYRHPGVDPLSVARAAANNLFSGERRSGASTLTMQLVRMLEPRPRTLRSKITEALRAFQLELRLSKREILEAYLRFLPYGKNLEGIEAASERFFGHSAAHLDDDDLLTLLAVPQHPSRRAPSMESRPHLVTAMRKIGNRLGMDPTRPLHPPTELRPLPQLGPHAAFYLSRRHPKQLRIETTLDRATQILAERVLAARRKKLGEAAIFNGAAVVLDHGSSEVRALVGNFDFFDERHGGQVAGFAVARSPGSALKPLIYADALDRGLLLPETLLEDVPHTYAGYRPSNYDGNYRGLVRAEEALSRSLNTVFLALVEKIGVDSFVSLLSRLDLDQSAIQPTMGLSIILGAVEATPLELTSAFATLARDGRYQRARILTGDRLLAPVRVFSPGAAFLTRRALALRDRPDAPARRAADKPHSIFWKTGTSYAQRDAWALGSDAEHAVGVWLGNFDRRPSPGLVGSKAAGPILFDILDGLAHPTTALTATAPPGDLRAIEVCSYSGYLPGPACDHTRTVLAPAGHLTRTCPFHRSVEIDVRSNQAISASCRPRFAGRATRMMHVVELPAELARVYGGPIDPQAADKPVRYAAGCEPEKDPDALVITSPAKYETILFVPGAAQSAQRVPLEASGVSAAKRIKWYVDGTLIGTARSGGRLLWTPALGEHEIVCSDGSTRAHRHVLVEPL